MFKFVSILASTTLFGAVAVYAQSSTSTTELDSSYGSTSTNRIERIEVTGSHIKQVDVEGPSPVQTLDSDYLEKTGYNSVGDVLREVTANTFGSAREKSGSNAAGVSSVNLRGLGADRTLVLVNGRRMAKDGVVASPDLNLIPMSAIERIDIQKDGASAIYGSDAVGGVVNIITKKNFVGTEFSARHEATEEAGGSRSTVSMTYGWANDRANFMITAQGKKNEKIFSRDREWTNGGESVASPYTNYVDPGTGKFVAGPNCPAAQIDAATGRCLYDYTQSSTSMPGLTQVNTFANFNIDLSANTSVFGQVSYVRKEVEWNYAPGAVRLTNLTLPYNWGGINTGSTTSLLFWRSEALGTRDTEVTTNSFSATTGARMYVSDTWEVQLSGGTDQVKREDISVNGYARADALKALIESGQYRFDTGGSIPESVRYNPFEIVKSGITYGDLKASGELFDLPGGALQLAVGTGLSYEKYSDTVDPLTLTGGVAGGGAGSSGYGTRKVYNMYSELAIPVLKNLDVQVAGRFDNYSDFGSTINPKVAVAYRPIKEILLRVSGGTGFKAPNMQEMYRAAAEGWPTFIDKKGCANGAPGACKPAQYRVRDAANPDLEEEKFKTFNAGIVASPIKEINVGVDFFHVDMENVVGLDLEAMTEAEAQGVTLPNTTIVRNADGTIRSVDTKTQNLAARTVQGIDVSFGFNKLFKYVGRVTLKNEYTLMLKYEEQGFPGTASKDILGENGAPRWKNNLALEYNPVEPLTFSFNFITTPGHERSVESEGELPRYTQFDAQVSYFFKSNTKLTLGAKNVLGSTPPLDRTNVNNRLDEELYDNVGRRFFAAIKQTF